MTGALARAFVDVRRARWREPYGIKRRAVVDNSKN
jgi:hypothetical protein